MTPAQLRTNAAWLRDQLVVLTGWIAGHPDRWPAGRTTVALRAIHAGDVMWRERVAEEVDAEVSWDERRKPEHNECTACGATMRSYDEYEEFQHAGCGGLVARKPGAPPLLLGGGK